MLDEPTNHLDVAAIEELERALDAFPGTVLLVTHDRRFLAGFRATRTLELSPEPFDALELPDRRSCLRSSTAVSQKAPFGVFPADTEISPLSIEKGDEIMGMGVSLVLVAVGAILVWAVNTTVSGIEIHTIGWILLAVGAIGALLSLIFWSSWGGFGGPADGRRRTVVREDY